VVNGNMLVKLLEIITLFVGIAMIEIQIGEYELTGGQVKTTFDAGHQCDQLTFLGNHNFLFSRWFRTKE
jgi:hypothetical protein